MVEIVRGTTPTLVFTLPDTVSTDDMAAIALDIVQKEKRLTRSDVSDFVLTEHGIQITLTQEETLKFYAGKAAMMLNWLYTNGARAASTDIDVTFLRNLHSEVMEGER